MITARGAMGFLLVWLGASLLLSVGLGLAYAIAARRLRALGPAAERRSALFVVALPPVVAGSLAAVLAIDSLRALRDGSDHCVEHAHHLHLCLRHGAWWGEHPGAMLLVGVAGSVVLVRIVRLVAAHLAGELAARRLARLASTPAALPDRTGALHLVPSSESFVFTAGIVRPTIFASTDVWARLDEAQRRAVLAHERGHVTRSDLRWRALLGTLGCFGMPPLVRRAIASWELASEQLCDRDALDAACDAATVASAIVTIARASADRAALRAVACLASCRVEERVLTLLDDARPPDRSPRAMTLLVALGSTLLLMAAALHAQPLHHAIETLLG